MKHINPDQLNAYRDVIELGSFSAAAERAGVSQPAVSQQVKELEKRFKLRLVERVGRKVTPTQAGQELLVHVARVNLALADAEEAMRRHTQTIGGTVRIGTGATACIHLLPPILRRLKAKFPSVNIVVSTGNTPEIVRRVEDNLLDAALVTLPAAGRSLQVTPVFEDDFVAIAPQRAAGLRRSMSPKAFMDLPLVLFEPSANTRRLVDEWLQHAGAPVVPVMELGNVEAIKEMVSAGLGWAILPRLSVATRGQRKGLKLVPLTPRLGRTLAWVIRRDKPLNRALLQVNDAVLALSAAKPRA